MFCIHVPMSEMPWPRKKRRKLRCDRAPKRGGGPADAATTGAEAAEPAGRSAGADIDWKIAQPHHRLPRAGARGWASGCDEPALAFPGLAPGVRKACSYLCIA